MATKKSTKSSSKTAHVLNVLSHPQGEDYTGDGVSDSVPSPDGPLPGPAQPGGHAQPLLPPILEDARSFEEAVSGQILEALSQVLVTEVQAAEPPKEPAPEEPVREEPVAAAPVRETPVAAAPVREEPVAAAPVRETPVAAAPVRETPVAAAPVREEPVAAAPAQEAPVRESPAPVEAAPTPVASAQRPSEVAPAQSAAAGQAPHIPRLHEQLGQISMAALSDDLVYVNVMQALVEEKAPKYIKMFGLCTCSRCVADVKAQALTCLPPKYAVMRSGECIPMLTVYEGRYSSALIAQILAACKLVMDNPRH